MVRLDYEILFWESWGFSSFVLAYGPSRQTCPSTSLSWPWGLQVGLQQPIPCPKKNLHIVWPSGQVRLSQTRTEFLCNISQKHYLPKARPIHQEVLDNILFSLLPVLSSWCAICLLCCGQMVHLDYQVFFWESCKQNAW